MRNVPYKDGTPSREWVSDMPGDMPHEIYVRRIGEYKHGEPKYHAQKSNGVLYEHTKYIRATEWQPIETAPKDGSHILLTDGISCEVCFYCGYWQGSYYDGYGFEYNNDPPTHWMPLPTPPKGEDND